MTPRHPLADPHPVQPSLRRFALGVLDFCLLHPAALPRARLMGAWDHCYPDSAFDPAVSTHYVNLPDWLALSTSEAAALTLPQGPTQQHARW